MTTSGDAPVAAARARAAPRELAIIGGFLVFVAIAIATVLVPALRDDAPDDADQAHPIVATPSSSPAPPTAPVPVPAAP